MRNTSFAQERYIATLQKRVDTLEKNNSLLMKENADLRAYISEHENLIERVRQLEQDYILGIQQAREIVAACKEMILDGRRMSKNFRKNAIQMVGKGC